MSTSIHTQFRQWWREHAVLGVSIMFAASFAIAAAGWWQSRVPEDPSIPRMVAVTGRYTCLPRLDGAANVDGECRFGIRTDAGDVYAVNFGASAGAMEQFKRRALVRLKGTFVGKEALSSDAWQAYRMKGILTVTELPVQLDSGVPDMRELCTRVAAYTQFSTQDELARFITDCESGEEEQVLVEYQDAVTRLDAQLVYPPAMRVRE